MQLPCPCCGEPKANVTVDLSSGTDFHCTECDTDFTAADIRTLIAKWTKALEWIGTMPADEDLDAEAEQAVADAA